VKINLETTFSFLLLRQLLDDILFCPSKGQKIALEWMGIRQDGIF
jgi:hypothetical protein